MPKFSTVPLQNFPCPNPASYSPEFEVQAASRPERPEALPKQSPFLPPVHEDWAQGLESQVPGLGHTDLLIVGFLMQLAVKLQSMCVFLKARPFSRTLANATAREYLAALCWQPTPPPPPPPPITDIIVAVTLITIITFMVIITVPS